MIFGPRNELVCGVFCDPSCLFPFPNPCAELLEALFHQHVVVTVIILSIHSHRLQ